MLLRTPSIQPKQRAASTDSGQVMLGFPESFCGSRRIALGTYRDRLRAKHGSQMASGRMLVLAAWRLIKLSQKVDAWKIKAYRQAGQAPPHPGKSAQPKGCATLEANWCAEGSGTKWHTLC